METYLSENTGPGMRTLSKDTVEQANSDKGGLCFIKYKYINMLFPLNEDILFPPARTHRSPHVHKYTHGAAQTVNCHSLDFAIANVVSVLNFNK